MSNMVQLNVKPTWLASFDLIRRPDGQLVLQLIDARTSLIEADPQSSSDKLSMLASMAEEGISAMRADAINLREPTP